MSMDKKSLRSDLLAKRLSLDPSDWQARSLRIVEHLEQHPLVLRSASIAIYQSFRKEVDVSQLMERLPGKIFYFPRTNLALGSMEFLRYESPDDFSLNRWGLSEPVRGNLLDSASSATTLIILPGLAYDLSGHRLGYGKGFYDRFLSTYPSATLGVCFSEYLLETLPTEPHDQPVNSVFTELGYQDISGILVS